MLTLILNNMKTTFASLTIVLAALLLFLPVRVQALTSPDDSNFNISEEGDAIAIRILPNPNHYNAIRWYKSQGFQGSPQSLMVDGYDAVRDGRSVYVNAANVDLASQTIYTNIYLISHNQGSDSKTVDVLGQLIKNWRFNSNLIETGQCNISTLICQNNSDCSPSFICSDLSDGLGRCVPEELQNCFIDSDCTEGVYCSSLRSKVNRDIRRLGILGDLRESLAEFRSINNNYPTLSAGTYIPYRSVSTWPSWKTSLLSQISSSQTSVDPINVLGTCPNFDSITCWNAETKSFADPAPNNDLFELPIDSYAYVYSSDENGSNYDLCAGMETKALGYNTAEGQLADSTCVISGSSYIGDKQNEAPYLVSTNLQGKQGQVFSGSIMVKDPENNYLHWSITPTVGNWSSWSNVPVLQDTYNPNQKRVYAQTAGAPGIYNLSLNVSDAYGGTLATVTPITITNNPPIIKSQDIDYYPSTILPLIVSFSVTDSDQPLAHQLTPVTNPPPALQLISETSNRVGDTVNYIKKYRTLTANNFSVDRRFIYMITAQDKYGNSSSRQLNINIKADPPALDFNCNKDARIGADYYCGLGWGKQGDHAISYSTLGGLPEDLILTTSVNYYEPIIDDTNTITTFWKNLGRDVSKWFGGRQVIAAIEPKLYYAIIGKPKKEAKNIPIKVIAVNEFSAVSEKEFSLNINTYCGDGVLQKPNSEGKGGLYNDGYEECDGLDGTTNNPALSGPELGYCCTTRGNTSFPINGNNQCTFLSSAVAGGYCGDSMCATNFENSINCPSDCGVNSGATPILTRNCLGSGQYDD